MEEAGREGRFFLAHFPKTGRRAFRRPPPVGSSRPENCPVDSFQQRTGGSPGKMKAEETLNRFLSAHSEPFFPDGFAGFCNSCCRFMIFCILLFILFWFG
jgi:hypothetical protein